MSQQGDRCFFRGRRAKPISVPLSPLMATPRHHHRPCFLPSRLHHISVPACSIYRSRRPSASLCSLPPPYSPSRFPKKRADHEAAADFGEEGGAVVDETAAAEQQRVYGGVEYVSTVGAGAGLQALLRAGRAGPGGDPVFFLLTAVAVSTSVAFSCMMAVAIPTMLAMRRAANSFATLADAALEELPSTMASLRLSGMEISDLTLELSHLSHDIADGVNKTAKISQAVEAGIGRMQGIARQQAISMVKERTRLQTISTAGQGNKYHKSSNQQ